MSDFELFLNSMNGKNADLIFVCLILLGTYFLFKNTFGGYLQRNLEQSNYFVQNIIDELKKTRESLIGQQNLKINFEERLQKVEEYIRRQH